MSSVETNTVEEIKIKVPNLWSVIIHNDDFTPVDFVIAILMEVFHLDSEAANALTQDVHNNGKAIIAYYTKEIAITKAQHVVGLAEECEHPLLATAQEA